VKTHRIDTLKKGITSMTILIEEQKPNWFASSRLGQFFASPAGRAARIVGGLLLIGGGLLLVGGIAGMVIAAVGLVPWLAGALDKCVFSALFRGPFSGSEIRACASD
jgi:hypothetical protein